MRIVSPAPNARFTIASDAAAPVIDVQTDATGPHAWDWSITWGAFGKRGTLQTPGNRLSMQPLLTDVGGTLSVSARVGRETARVSVTITGTNPAVHEVTAYLATKPDSDGFAVIIQHETQSLHFTPAGEPIRSFDNGYGICQLTSPAPTYEQCWSWKRNIDAGLTLFAEKTRAGRTHLSQQNRTYTADQLRREAVSRWNGGAYHEWDGTAWARNPDVLCDTATGNIGWNMTDARNAGQTEADLRRRDSPDYRRGRRRGDPWRYTGVCYADQLLG